MTYIMRYVTKSIKMFGKNFTKRRLPKNKFRLHTIVQPYKKCNIIPAYRFFVAKMLPESFSLIRTRLCIQDL